MYLVIAHNMGLKFEQTFETAEEARAEEAKWVAAYQRWAPEATVDTVALFELHNYDMITVHTGTMPIGEDFIGDVGMVWVA